MACIESPFRYLSTRSVDQLGAWGRTRIKLAGRKIFPTWSLRIGLAGRIGIDELKAHSQSGDPLREPSFKESHMRSHGYWKHPDLLKLPFRPLRDRVEVCYHRSLSKGESGTLCAVMILFRTLTHEVDQEHWWATMPALAGIMIGSRRIADQFLFLFAFWALRYTILEHIPTYHLAFD